MAVVLHQSNMRDSAEQAGVLQIVSQGSFTVGGSIKTFPGIFVPHSTDPAGQTLHGDHASIIYQIPVNARRLPLAFLHGDGQSARTWQTTADGREGFQNLFLRRNHSVYLIDQPRRGCAGQSTLAGDNPALPNDQAWYEQFRIGIWPDLLPNVQFSDDPNALQQFFRQITPNTGPFDTNIAASGVAALFDRIGPAILVSHSQGGGVGWAAVPKANNIRAVVSFEPGSGFPFPAGSCPPPMPSSGGALSAVEISDEAFDALTRIPIILYYGDNIPETPSANRGQDIWRVRLAMARIWADAVNARGGDVSVVHLPSLGIMGNTHFPFSDLNNVEIADVMSQFLNEKNLDL